MHELSKPTIMHPWIVGLLFLKMREEVFSRFFYWHVLNSYPIFPPGNSLCGRHPGLSLPSTPRSAHFQDIVEHWIIKAIHLSTVYMTMQKWLWWVSKGDDDDLECKLLQLIPLPLNPCWVGWGKRTPTGSAKQVPSIPLPHRHSGDYVGKSGNSRALLHQILAPPRL